MKNNKIRQQEVTREESDIMNWYFEWTLKSGIVQNIFTGFPGCSLNILSCKAQDSSRFGKT